MAEYQRGWRRPLLGLLALASMLGSVLVPTTAEAFPVPDLPPVPVVEPINVEITDDGVSVSTVITEAGQSIIWSNSSSDQRTLTSDTGLIDSGSIPVGGAYVASVAAAGVVSYRADVGPAASVVVAAGLDGADGTPAAAAIPATPPPPSVDSDFAQHPTLVIEASFSRLLVGFADGATVAQVGEALDASGVVAIGGMPSAGVLVVEVPGADTTFAALEVAQGLLEGRPGIGFVAKDVALSEATVPAPAEVDATGANTEMAHLYDWDDPIANPLGLDSNWVLEASRFPQAWNAEEHAAARGSGVLTGIVDSGFDHADQPHKDLDALERELSCEDFSLSLYRKCFGSGGSDHGTHVAGIIGADHDDLVDDVQSEGVVGANPLADMVAFKWSTDNEWLGLSRSRQGSSLSDLTWTFQRMFNLVRSGARSGLRVVNFSADIHPDPAAWIATHGPRGNTCGAGPSPDLPIGSAGPAPAGANQPCTPMNEDGWLSMAAADGAVVSGIAAGAAGLGIMLVVAAGNQGNDYCPGASGGLAPWPCANPFVAPAPVFQPFAVASQSWNTTRNPLDNPVIVVEAIGPGPPAAATSSAEPWFGTPRAPNLALASYSNTGGDVSAPGVTLSTCVIPTVQSYCWKAGTSMAAPLVTGLLTYMLEFDPSLSIRQLRQALATRPDTGGGAQPRIDAFASVMQLSGTPTGLVDVNDPSPDGNRRIMRFVDGSEVPDEVSSIAGGQFTDPDGVVDMRDFRRFRDAWLQSCEAALDVNCAAGVSLDGAPDHPKRDLNFDGCVSGASVAACVTPEERFSRFDFNGDGVVSSLRPTPFPVDAGGNPTTDTTLWQTRTDLEVLQSGFAAGTPGAEGWVASDLDALMLSGDLEVHAEGTFADGAAAVELRVEDPSGINPTHSQLVDPDRGVGVVTIASGTQFHVRARALDGAGVELESTTFGPMSLQPGEDQRLDLDCSVLELSTGSPNVGPTGSVQLTADIDSCAPGAEAGATVDFEVRPTGPGSPSLTPSTVTDADGVATATLTGGSAQGAYTVTATATVIEPGGESVVADTATVIIDNAYSFEVIADSDGDLDTLGWGPSINDNGDVAFAASDTSGASPDTGVFVVPDGGNRIRLDSGEVRSGVRPYAQVELGDDGAVWTLLEEVEPELRRSVVRFDTSGGSEEIARSHSTLGTPDADAHFEVLGLPASDDDGDVVVPALPLDHGGGSIGVLATPDGAGGFLNGPTLANPGRSNASLGSRVDRADDGTAALTAEYVTAWPGPANPFGRFEREVLVGPGVLDTAQSLAAASQGWRDLSDPALSDDAAVATFAGDRGNGEGLFLSWRGASGYTDPVAVLGENSIGWTEELGSAPDGSPRYFKDFENDQAVEVIHREAGPDGLAGDVAVIVFGAEPNAAGEGFTAEKGLWSLIVHLAATGEPSEPIVAVPERPQVLAQLGDDLAGDSIEGIGWHDPIGTGTNAELEGHQVVYRVRTPSHQQIIRATWDGLLEFGSGVGGFAMGKPLLDSAVRLAGEAASLAAASAVQQTDPSSVGNAVAAMTLSDSTPEEGQTVTITNRSRAVDGTAAAASFSAGAGSSASLGADATIEQTWSEYGTRATSMMLSGTDLAATLEIDVLAGPTPPTADAGGPYSLDAGHPLTVDASGTTDPNREDELTFEWDLDNNGAWDDGTGEVVTLEWADVESVVCAGECLTGVPYTVGLRVTDPGGLADETTAQVEFTGRGDFGISISPAEQPVNPGETTEFIVYVDAGEGFEDSVSLTVEGLPDGWNGWFSPASISAGEPSLMRIEAPSDAIEGDVPITVVGRSGDLVRRTTSDVSVTFALIPVCTGSVLATVVDGDSALPVADARVKAVSYSGGSVQGFTGDDGVVLLEGVAARPDPRFSLSVTADGYLSGGSRGTLPVACDATTPATIEILPRLYGSFAVRVVVGEQDSQGNVVATDVPIEGATVLRSTSPTDADGWVREDNYEIDRDGTLMSMSASFGDHWSSGTVHQPFSIETPHAEFLIPLLPICSVELTFSGVVRDQFGEPVENSRVSSTLGSVYTDSDGRYEVTDVRRLAQFNRPISINARAYAPSDWPPDSEASPSHSESGIECGDDGTYLVDFEVVRGPEELFGSVSGVITNEFTGEPVAGARVKAITPHGTDPLTVTAADGTYRIDGVAVGSDPSLPADVAVEVSAVDYWLGYAYPSLSAGEVAVVDVAIRPHQFTSVEGRITDRVTGEPIEGASVNGKPTDADGNYRIDRIQFGYDAAPFTYGIAVWPPFVAGLSDWYQATGSVDVRVGEVAHRDFALQPVCQGANIRGVVLNAETLEPIEGAVIRTLNHGNHSSQTGVDGLFELLDVRTGANNQPAAVRIQASAPGFVTQERYVTVFCDANINVDFGPSSAETGSVVGSATDGNGSPIPNVFVGSGFGGSDTTDAAGEYRIEQAPLHHDGSPREWLITAVHPDDRRQEQPVTVESGTDVRADFTFADSPPTTTTTTTTLPPTTTTTTTTLPPTTTTTTALPPTTTTTTTTVLDSGCPLLDDVHHAERKREGTRERHSGKTVRLCHATGSETNPYVVVTVSRRAVLQGGHGDHSGDIIPPFPGYAGHNWPSGEEDGGDDGGHGHQFVRVHRVFLDHFRYGSPCF